MVESEGMPRRIILPVEDRDLIRDLIDDLEKTQSALAEEARLTPSWLSSVLRNPEGHGKAKSPGRVEADLIERAVAVLAGWISDSDLQPDQKNQYLIRIKKYNAGLRDSLSNAPVRPGDILQARSTSYVARREQNELLSILESPPTSALVSGPPQVGVSAMMKHLELRAIEIGLQTSFYDPEDYLDEDLALLDQEQRIEAFATSLYEQLCAEWALNEAAESPTTLLHLHQWLQKNLRPTSGIPRVLILDNLNHFGPEVIESIVSLFIRPLHNKRATGGANLYLVLGYTYQFGDNFARLILEISSKVAWQPRVDINWFKTNQVDEMFENLKKEGDDECYLLLRGQPYLTHAFVADEEFAQALKQWDQHPDDDHSIKGLQGTKFYNNHKNAIASAISGSKSHFGKRAKRVLDAWKGAVENRLIKDPDVEEFLNRCHIVVDNRLTIKLYSLIVQDLLQVVGKQ